MPYIEVSFATGSATPGSKNLTKTYLLTLL